MTKKPVDTKPVELDLSDVDHRVGKPVGGGQLWDPCSTSDIRRWVMAMDNPNPIHWDHEFARNSRFGGIIAPQSIAVGLDYGHGAAPACVGYIPESHLIFGGEEWWFYGCPVRPGDKLFQERRFHDYKVTETKFAGPTMFSRGDTVHKNQNGVLVAKERSTAIRYLSAEATKRGMYENQLGEKKKWTNAELLEIENLRYEWLLTTRSGISPRFDEVKVGDTLPRRVLGPHTIASFTTEYRAFLFNIWGTFEWVAPEGIEDPWVYQDPAGSKDSASTRKAPRSIRANVTVSTSALRADTSTRRRPAKSAWRAPTDTAPRWARGAPTSSPTGRASTAWCATSNRISAGPPSKATSRTSMPRSSTRNPCRPGAYRSSRSSSG